MNISYKDNNLKPLDVDEKSRRVKVVISEMGSKDYDNDVIEKGAYDKTIRERGPKGANLIYHLRDHDSSVSTGLIGKFSDIYVEGKQLIGVSTMPDTVIGNDMAKMYAGGLISQHSVGITVTQKEMTKGESPYRSIREVKLWEGSAVLFGANPNTPTLSYGKSIDKPEYILKMAKQMAQVARELREGKYTDETFELLEIYSKQLEDKYELLTKEDTTEAAGKALQPDELKEFTDRLLLLTIH